MKTEAAAVIYDAVLSVPGMEVIVKINLSISRKKVLLLSQVMEAGLLSEETGVKQLVASLAKEAPAEIKMLADEFLEKSGLTELSKKLKSIT